MNIKALIALFLLPGIAAASLSGLLFQGCAPKNPVNNISAIKSYLDIPGINVGEIAAIEAFKTSGRSFTYGSLKSMEAFNQYDGSNAGFSVMVCELLSGLFGIPFRLEIHEWEVLKARLDNMSLDFASDITPTQDRRKTYFMTHPIAERSLRIFTHEYDDRFHVEEDVNGLRIGFYKGSITAQSVLDIYPELHFEIVELSDAAEVAASLASGVIDVFIGDATSTLEYEDYPSVHSRDFFPLVYTPVSMTTANSELVPVITVIDKYIEAGGIDRLFDLYKKGRHEYAKYELKKSFTEDEAAYIANLVSNGLKVPIALENGNYPVSFYNKNDRKFQGIALDILSEITEMTGIEFHMATDENTLWSESLEKLNSNEVALISQLLHTPDRDGKYLWSNNYSNSHYALLSRADFPYLEMYQVVMAKVGVFRNSAYEEMYHFWFPVNNNVIYYDTAMEGINALEKGEIYLLMASENMLIAITHYLEKPGYKVNILFHTVEESYFGFNLNEEILCSIFHKTQYFIDSEKISTFWSGRIFDYSRKISQARLPWLIGVAVLFLCVIILMSLMFRRLRREGRGLETIVDERTAELNRQNSLMSTVNTAAAFLLEPGTDDGLIAINRSMGMVCQNMDIDRAHLWKNVRKDDGKLYFQQLSKWVSAGYATDNKLPEFAFEDTPSFWSSLFSQGKSLNGPVDSMPENEREFFSLYKIQSILAVPLFLEGELWGFVSFDDCHSRRYFSEADEHTLRSWGLLVMGATQRGEIMNDLKNAVDDARKASSEAENASTAKSHFLANMSHEMRTPMNVIVGLTDLMLEDGYMSSAAKNNLEKINTAGNTLMGLINDVLDISKIEAGRLDLMPVQYEVASLLNDIITLNIIRIEEKPITFKLDLDENLPCFLFGDDLRVKQILNNLLSNAFKYTKEGTVTLDVGYRREGRRKDDKIWLSFCVSDTGIGIRTKDMEKLFSDYNQVDTHANRQIVGTGLGLSITRKFVDLMDGEISVESEYGKGSTFRVSISQGFVTDKVIGKETIETLHGFRYIEKIKRAHEKLVRSDLSYAQVLVVDDLATNLDVAAGMLRKYKMQVDCVTGGQEAIDLIVAGERIYDAIFMDHMMPGMDGMEATAMIRALGTEYAQKIPIIALTANVVAGNEQMFLDNGFNAFLPKPFNVMLLDSIIQRWVRDKSRDTQ